MPANNLLEIRERAGLRLEDVASRSGLTLYTVRRVQDGCEAKTSTLTRLAAALGVTVGQLLGTEPLPPDTRARP